MRDTIGWMTVVTLSVLSFGCKAKYTPHEGTDETCIVGESSGVAWDADPGLGITGSGVLEALAGSYAVTWQDVHLGEGFLNEVASDELIVGPAQGESGPTYRTLHNDLDPTTSGCPDAWLDVPVGGQAGLTGLAVQGELDGHEWFANSTVRATAPNEPMLVSLEVELPHELAVVTLIEGRYLASCEDCVLDVAAISVSWPVGGADPIVDIGLMGRQPDGTVDILTVQRGHIAALE